MFEKIPSSINPREAYAFIRQIGRDGSFIECPLSAKDGGTGVVFFEGSHDLPESAETIVQKMTTSMEKNHRVWPDDRAELVAILDGNGVLTLQRAVLIDGQIPPRRQYNSNKPHMLVEFVNPEDSDSTNATVARARYAVILAKPKERARRIRNSKQFADFIRLFTDS
jgi:hypothetical protein